MNQLKLLTIAIVVVCLAGCSKKLSKEQKQALANGALSAKERAIAFNLVRNFIVAADDSQAPHVSRYAVNHAAGLAADAKALADLSAAANQGALKDQSLQVIRMVAANAKARAENFTAMKKHIAVRSGTIPPAQFVEFVKTHEVALKGLADQLDAVAQKVAKAKKKE